MLIPSAAAEFLHPPSLCKCGNHWLIKKIKESPMASHTWSVECSSTLVVSGEWPPLNSLVGAYLEYKLLIVQGTVILLEEL